MYGQIIKKFLKKLKKKFPGIEEEIEKELIPLKGEEIKPIKKKRKI